MFLSKSATDEARALIEQWRTFCEEHSLDPRHFVVEASIHEHGPLAQEHQRISRERRESLLRSRATFIAGIDMMIGFRIDHPDESDDQVMEAAGIDPNVDGNRARYRGMQINAKAKMIRHERALAHQKA